ncbi:hypothetical protein CHS0354_036142 [Potamilus streckersoni]|uniref:EF-hand domain-containing protein n=1 Tax=Potamilus streckersoni TaxID=2493646 RepID=A0AAE0T493_9BIVA|nr:hypothetical protein CHS0354_036142 [Potamilus streckersoni]
MSSYDEQYEGMNPHPSQEELKEMMAQKAYELFKVCDVEEKGFITKRDMQRLQSELPLTPDQLESVFDSLDDDGNGYLTLEEFTEGFGSFIGLKTGASTEIQEMDSEAVYGDEQIDHIEEEQQFVHMMNNVEAHNLFDDENTIKALWSRLRREDPELSGHFEDFLYKVSNDIKKSKENFNTLESALKSKSSAHDQEVKKLYEEMEYQIKQEKEKAVAEEQLKERQMRETLERELREKDLALQDMLHKHQEEKEKLEEELMKSQQNLEESKYYINQLKDQQKDEKRERARAALKLSEGIALERESLVKQLDMLRDVNRKLRDDKDEAEIRRILEGEQRKSESKQSPRKEQFERKGSILSNYFPSNRVTKRPTEGSISEDVGNTNIDRMDDGIECDDDMIETSDSFEFNHNQNNQSAHHKKNYHLRHSGQISDQNAKHKYDDGSHSDNEYEPHEGSTRHGFWDFSNGLGSHFYFFLYSGFSQISASWCSG